MSFLSIFTPILIVVVVLAFVFELMDASLGIGFGTAFTPLLLIVGYDLSLVVPSVLVSELAAGLVAMIFHALLKNVRLGQKRVFRLRRRRRKKVYTLPESEMVKTNATKESVGESEIDLEELEEDEEEEEIIVEDDEELKVDEEDEIEEIKLENGSIRNRIRNLTTDSKVIIILSVIGIFAAVIAAIMNVIFETNDVFNLSIKIYIGVMVFGMGILILALRNIRIKFSMKRIIALGALAGFNKGISGGGYRPVTVAGQILAGRGGRSALASTTFSKTAVSLVSALSYVISHVAISYGETITWEYLKLAPFILIGTVLAAPLGALVTKKVESKWLKLLIGWGTVALGLFSIVRITLDHYNIWDIIPKAV